MNRSGLLPVAFFIDGMQQRIDVFVLFLGGQGGVQKFTSIGFAVAERSEDFERFFDDVVFNFGRNLSRPSRRTSEPFGEAWQ